MLVRPIEPFNSVLPEVPDGIILTPNDVLRDDNPHVKSHPDMFTEVAESFRGTRGLVEEATAKPGQKRNR